MFGLQIQRPAVLVVLDHLYLVETDFVRPFDPGVTSSVESIPVPSSSVGPVIPVLGEIGIIGPVPPCAVGIEETHVFNTFPSQSPADTGLVHARHFVVHLRRRTGNWSITSADFEDGSMTMTMVLSSLFGCFRISSAT